ncbi:hypothetical protein LCGC14_1498200 [marine sediment metagenome]|uniref:Uncharacterized protein n=1 Tax=marine sediment metagenome TaxID=412755 RepID=A0A0F9JQP7_9ZZZZ
MTETTITDAQVPEVLDALDRWIRQRSGLDPNDYFQPGLARPGEVVAFHTEQRTIAKQRKTAMDALAEAWSLEPSGDALMYAFGNDRLQWDGEKLNYVAGQYFCTEYRPAAERILTAYCGEAKRLRTKRKGGPFYSVSEIKALNEANGQYWFSPDTRRFFASRYGETIYGGWFFVSSEKACFNDHTRVYTVRQADAYGSITTGDQFPTRARAIAAAKYAAEALTEATG